MAAMPIRVTRVIKYQLFAVWYVRTAAACRTFGPRYPEFVCGLLLSVWHSLAEV